MSESTLFDLEDQRRLNLTQTVRETIIAAMTKSGVPGSVEDRNFLMAALDGLDRNVISTARIKAQDKNANANEALIEGLAHFLKNNTAARDQTPPASNLAEVSLPDITPVEGETSIGVEPIHYDEFMDKQEE